MKRTVLLALDTSTEFCSVALLIESASPADGSSHAHSPEIHIRHEDTGPVSSTRLLPAIAEIFADAGLTLADCDAIAFGAGPGSFTGLRTATGVAQGLAFGLNLPVVPVSTLLACAELARLHESSVTRVLVAIDARMNEAYWADYRWDAGEGTAGDWTTLHPASLDVPEAIPAPDEAFTLAGNAATAFGERLSASTSASCRIDTTAVPHALAVAHAGLRAFKAGRTVAADQAAPDYIRNKVAQTTAERTQARAEKDAAALNAHANALAQKDTPEPTR